MPAKWEFTAIMESGHHYAVIVEARPFKNTQRNPRYHDPCTVRCGPEIQKEMKELHDKLRKGLEK